MDNSYYRMKNLLENLSRMGGPHSGVNAMQEEQPNPVQPPMPMGEEGFQATGVSSPPEVPHLYFDPKAAWEAEQPEETQRGLNMLDAYKPQTSANDRFERLIDNYPERDKPSFMRKLSASLVGFGGNVKGADEILNRPFNRKREVWEDQTKVAQQAANLERYENANERSLLAQQDRANATDRRLDEYERRGREYDKARQARTAALQFKQDNPDLQIKVDEKTGNLIGINRKNGTSRYITGPDGSPVSGRDLSFEERQNILQDNALERIRTGGKFKAEDSPNEIKTARLNRANELLTKYPEWEDWIKEDTDRPGEFKIAPVGTPGFFGRSGPTQEEHDYISDYIYGPGFSKKPITKPGKDVELPGSETPSNVPSVRQPGAVNKPTQYGDKISKDNGRLPDAPARVRNKKTGQTGTIPFSRLNDYLANGYEKVN